MPGSYTHSCSLRSRLAPCIPCQSTCTWLDPIQIGAQILEQKQPHLLFNILLDIRRIQDASALGGGDDFRHEFGVGNGLAGLHDANDGGLGFVVAVGGDALVGFFVFGDGFFGLDLVDFDAVFCVGEAEVDGEGVGVVDVFAFGGLGQDPVFGAC